MRPVFLAAALMFAVAPPAFAARDDNDPLECLLTASLPAHAPTFANYPTAPLWQGPSAEPRLATRMEKVFRTQLKTQAREKPDFAGHYHIATWGCGAACIDWGMIDSKTGRVVMGDTWGDVNLMHVMDQPLMYKPDSRLFIILGAPSEKPEREGFTYLLWTGKAFKRIAFYPYKAYCRPQTQPVP